MAEDIPDTTATTTTLEVGQTIASDLELGDEDWFRIEVTVGETYTIATEDGDSGAIQDSFLVLYDANGTALSTNDDDGPGFHASLEFEATSSVYYVAVTTFETYQGHDARGSGSYKVSLEQEGADTAPEMLPALSNDEIAYQLSTGYWENTGRASRGFDLEVDAGQSATIYVDLTGLDAAGQWFAEQALAAWSAVSGLTFSAATPPGGGVAGIVFDDENSGAYASTTTDFLGNTINVAVNVSKAWIAGDHYDFDSYALQTYIHEIGHALGLGHAGQYNTGEGLSITYSSHAEFANDSWQTTVMSYFSQTENTAVEGTKAYLLTPMGADILAVRDLYGTAGTLRTGDTVYGEGSTANDHFGNLTKFWGDMAFTLVDDGGHDLLDVSDTVENQKIDLNPEAFSDLNGNVGTMTIARGSWIEDATSGSGFDALIGNDVDNLLRGGRGADEIWGRQGNDDLRGGRGHDAIAGGQGADSIYGGVGYDSLYGGRGADQIYGGDLADMIIGQAGDDVLYGENGRDVFVFAPGDGSDRIMDFHDGRDQIDLRAFDLNAFEDVAGALSQVGASVVLDLGSSVVEIVATDLDQLDASDFLI